MGSVDREIPQGSVFGRIARVALNTAIAYEPFFSHSGQISTFQQSLRWGVESAAGPLFNTEVRHIERLAVAEKFLSEGVGVVIDPTHLLRRDTAEIYRLLCRNPEFRKVPVGIIVAEHMKEWWFKYAHGAYHSELIYVQTEHTKQEYEKAGLKFDDRKALDILNSALDRSSEILEQGGILIVFGQGERSMHLYDANPTFIYRLYKRAKERANEQGKEGPDFAIVPVGMDLDESFDVDDYEMKYDFLKSLQEEDLTAVQSVVYGSDYDPSRVLKKNLNRKLPYFIDVGYADHVSNYLVRAGGNPHLLDYVVSADQADLVTDRYVGADFMEEA